jgi:hypothetical protein
VQFGAPVIVAPGSVVVEASATGRSPFRQEVSVATGSTAVPTSYSAQEVRMRTGPGTRATRPELHRRESISPSPRGVCLESSTWAQRVTLMGTASST